LLTVRVIASKVAHLARKEIFLPMLYWTERKEFKYMCNNCFVTPIVAYAWGQVEGNEKP